MRALAVSLWSIGFWAIVTFDPHSKESEDVLAWMISATFVWLFVVFIITRIKDHK